MNGLIRMVGTGALFAASIAFLFSCGGSSSSGTPGLKGAGGAFYVIDTVPKNNGKVVLFFAYKEHDTVKLMAVLRTDKLLVAGCDAPDVYPSMSVQCEPFHMFEREIAEQYGIKPEGHPWLRMVRYHPNDQGRPDNQGGDDD